MKVRVSHFTSKGIPIDENTRPVPAKIEILKPTSKRDDTTSNSTTSKKRIPAREWIKSEIK